jgi:Core-2/I-Branching enzyme
MCREYFPEWFQYSWIAHDLRGGVKPTPPHGFVITKGYTHMAVTRAFVEYALNNPIAQDLLHWMSDIKVPDEHFFQTLNHSPQLNIPGSYRGKYNVCSLYDIIL